MLYRQLVRMKAIGPLLTGWIKSWISRPFQAFTVITYSLIINTFTNIGFLAPARIVDKELAT